nr:MAG TPA: hypothetical protein [Crassvirales sp.]
MVSWYYLYSFVLYLSETCDDKSQGSDPSQVRGRGG